MHVHVLSGHGEAKFWLEPALELERSHGLNQSELGRIRAIVEVHEDEIKEAWRRHFGS